MFNRYIPEDREAFEDLYRPVEETTQDDTPPAQETMHEPEVEKEEKKPAEKSTAALGGKLSMKNILKGFNVGELGIVPLLLLLFLVLDVEEDEKLLIIALAFILGI